MSDSDRTASLMSPAKLAQLRPRVAASPAAWLDQMAADAGSLHARRLLELRQQLEAQVRERDYKPAIGGLKAVVETLSQLDFTLVQPRGWLARATGKGKGQGTEFAAQAARVTRSIEDARDEARALVKRHEAQSGAVERTLVEFDVELKAIEKILDQGARWLQDMRNQLKARQAAQPDAEAQTAIDADAARCEILVARLKTLRGASSVVQHVQQEIAGVMTRRESAHQMLQLAMDTEAAGWLKLLDPVAAAAAEGGDPPDGMAQAQSVLAQLQVTIKRAAKELIELRSAEHALADELAAIARPLQDAS